MANLGAVAGTILTWPLLVRLGQRATLLLGLPLCLLSWFTLVFATHVWLLQTARFTIGLTSCLLTPAANLYLLEISHKKIRGRLLGVMTLARNLGSLVVTLIGMSSLTWREVGLVCSTLSAIPFLGVLWLPNSPRWLVTQHRGEDALSALTFFRKEKYDPAQEIQDITKQVEGQGSSGGTWNQMRMLFHSQALKTFCVLSLISVLVAFCGSEPLSSYLVPILQKTQSDGDPYVMAVVYSSVRILGIIVHLGVVDKLGRKPLIVASFFMCSMSTAAYATYFHVLDGTVAADVKWLPLTLLLLFSLFSGVGLPVITALQGELLPTTCRVAGLSLLTCVLMLASFTSSHTYYMTAETLGLDGAFWFYSCCSALLVLVSILCVPETKGRTLEDISASRRHSKHSLKAPHSGPQERRPAGKEAVSTTRFSVWTILVSYIKRLKEPTIQHPA